MEYIDQIVNRIIDNFDFAYMLVINVLTYLSIKVYEYIKQIKSALLMKRLILVGAIIVIGGIYLLIGELSKIVLLNSSILAPVFYSWMLKPILDKFGINYMTF